MHLNIEKDGIYSAFKGEIVSKERVRIIQRISHSHFIYADDGSITVWDHNLK